MTRLQNDPKILRKIDWIPNNSQIIKLDRFGNEKHKILISKKSYDLNSATQRENISFI